MLCERLPWYHRGPLKKGLKPRVGYDMLEPRHCPITVAAHTRRFIGGRPGRVGPVSFLRFLSLAKSA